MMAARAAVWNARWALLYSLGGWTALGGMMHYSYRSAGAGAENENHPPPEDSVSREVVVTDTPIGLKITTVTTYNKDFVSPATRLLRSVKSFFDPTDSPPSEK
ncbi:small integral membrane protein 26 [Anser cygnoides]|uniref:small integral membrane protein 26 n=1 Tax=Anser cygnoides TaxID=8845 RepID=UPI0034D3292D